ncbi:MAG TPA: di-heme oxidoredictase family protein [Polyangiaceae bacterium]|nr:di-heme oxidoredictase family protein [Polyangiaceae bacterium]
MPQLSNTSTIAAILGLSFQLAACGSGGDPATSNPSASAGNSSTTTAGSGGSPAATGGSGTGTGASAMGGAASGGMAMGGNMPVAGGHSASPGVGGIVPLFDDKTVLEPEVHYETADAIVTRWADRGRDRHAREENFQSYDHYLPHYWVDRTARYILKDHVAKGGSTIDVSWVSEWKLDKLPEFRAWYSGRGSVAQYYGNYAPRFKQEGPGTYDAEHNRTGDGVQWKYTYTIETSIGLDGKEQPLAVGQYMEIEASQFLDFSMPNPPIGRDNYYGTVFLYAVGTGGMVPWHTTGTWEDQNSERENSHPIPEKFWLGGRTTLPYQYSDEPENHFLQMATNLSDYNGQNFVLGRRVHHTDMLDGHHDESDENEPFTEIAGLVGPNYVNSSCDNCHHKNGRAKVADIGVPLDKWVFKVAGADGKPDPMIGSVLQPQGTGGSQGEGKVSIAQWVEKDGLRSPQYAFAGTKPALFSARIAPQLVGLGLLEAVPEADILALEDVNDVNGDGISGKANVNLDPVTGDKRLGRFGWKAGATSLRHQISGALNTDMGVMTSVLPKPDCGSAEQNCGNDKGMELPDEHLNHLIKYVSLLGVRAQRGFDDPVVAAGEKVFGDLGCAACHVSELHTSKFAALAELRDQTIHPYTDLLVHDMGEGLADNLGEHEATGAEWRTTPLWGLGLSACVTGGVEGQIQHQTCTPHHDYLHDGRARTIEEAILWHGGEGQKSRDAYTALSSDDKNALLKFLESL